MNLIPDTKTHVLKYKIFDDTEDFEIWQKENTIQAEYISSIQAVNRNSSLDKVTLNTEVLTNFVGILVIYWDLK